MSPKTKVIKTNIDKYIFLFSKHASTTTSSGMTTDYNWNIDPQMINEQYTLEIVQTRFGQETSYATGTWVSTTSITIGVSNTTTNGYYVIRPSVTLVGGSGSGVIVTVVLTNGRVSSLFLLTNGRVSSIVVSGTMTVCLLY